MGWLTFAIGVACGLGALGGTAPAHAASVRSISVAPGDQTLPPATTFAYTATARLADGTTRDVTDDVTWETDDRDLARFDADVPGSLRARRPGEVKITATLGGKTASATLTIDPGDVVRLITRPSTKKIELDRPMQLECRLVYESGYQEDATSECRWTSRNPDVAKARNHSKAGLVVPKELGETFIRARHPATGLKNADGDVRVLPPIDKVRFEDATVVLGRGMSTELRVVGWHGESGERSRLSDDLRFSTDAEGASILDLVATGKDAGTVTAKRDGVALVRVWDSIRKRGTGKKNAIVVMIGGVLEALEVLPNPFKLNAGDTRNASVFGILSSGLKTGNLRKLVEWSVDDSSYARVGNGDDDVGEVEGKKAGTTTLMATYDEFDVVSTASDNLVVRGKVTGLEIDPPDATIGLDMTYPLRAYANRNDGGRSNVSSSATWTAKPEGVVEIDDEGRVTGVTNGLATVTAADPKTGFEASADVTVAGRLRAIDVPTVKVDKDTEKKAKAFGQLSSGLTTSDLRLLVRWKVEKDEIARVGNEGDEVAPDESRLDPGEVLGLTLGTTTLTATEPVSGLVSEQTRNLTIRAPGSSDPDPDPDPDPNPGPAPIEPPRITNLFVVVEPGNDGLVQTGQTVTYKARATRSDGSKKNISDKCDWTIDDPRIATVDDALPKKGGVTGHAIGTTTVRIDCNGLTASGLVDVVGDVVALTILPDSFTIERGADKQLRAKIHFSNGDSEYVTREIDWYSTNPDVVDVENENEGQRGRVYAHDISDEDLPGEALIYAVDPTGHVGTSLATVNR